MPTFGAYTIVRREEGDALFDFQRRRPGEAVPPEQARVAKKVKSAIQTIMDAHVDEQTKTAYIHELENSFRKGCVQELPNPKDALAEVGGIADRFFERQLVPQIDGLQKRYFIYSATLLVVSAIIGLVLRIKFLRFLPIEKSAVSNYAFAWSAAMAASIVADSVAKEIKDVEIYLQIKHKLRWPAVRAFATGFVAVAIAIALSQDAISLKFGELKSSDVPRSTALALLVGFVTGLASSELIKGLIAKARKAIE